MAGPQDRTDIAYDGGRPSSVTLAAPAEGAPRPAHHYEHPSPTEARVQVAGVTSAPGWARRVTMDTFGRALSGTDATGHSTSYTWGSGDRLALSTDAAGRVTAMHYDHAGRPSATFGPAPSSCFTGPSPNGSCPPVARRSG
ncbi:MAG: hypothetical protein AB1673_13045 [Actinomycetota bacterium]